MLRRLVQRARLGMEAQVPFTLQEFDAGVAYWRTTRWPADFHNDFYRRMKDLNPNGNFNTPWWIGFLKELGRWRATRGRTHQYLTTRAQARFASLGQAWSTGCAPNLDKDISGVTWEQVAAFADTVAEIKNVRSPVFTSKFCHFLLPQVFPVVDNRAMGNPFRIYKSYFEFVQREWSETQEATRSALCARLDRLIGPERIPTYPTVNKVAELCLIGRRQLRARHGRG